MCRSFAKLPQINMRILFLLKRNLIYGSYNSVIAKSGLLNSARITAHQLHKHLGYKTEVEVCTDGNEVDKFVHKHRPKVVIIEALWVTPKKIHELTKLHKRVIFIPLMHSEVPFLAHEGNAMDWIQQYNELDNVFPAFNSAITNEQFLKIGINSLYLPNVYFDVKDCYRRNHNRILNIACFGAVRPFKNQLMQAMAAKVAARKLEMHLHFHMNTTRLEQGGESVYKNIKALLGHSLQEHGWKNREDFLELVKSMDVGMQVSFSESFNIVSADFVHENVPCIVSQTISWMPDIMKIDPEDMDGMVEKIISSLAHREKYAEKQVKSLNKYNKNSLKEWTKLLIL